MKYMTIGPPVELRYFKSNMHKSSCQSQKQVMANWNWSSGELYGPWASCYFKLPLIDSENIKGINYFGSQ